MKEPVLVVMAAGMGSRYGGLKQIDPVDQEGHIIMDFSIYDAVRAGFKKVIFIIKKENEQDFRDAIGDRLSDKVEIVYVHQDLNNIPEGFQVPEGRVKPWGTGHAVLSCAGEIDGPFVVINADDYYGTHAFKMAYDFLIQAQEDTVPAQYMMVFLEKSIPENPLKCEYFLPFVVDELLQEKKAAVRVLTTQDKWYGVTYKEDKPVVVAAIQNLKDQGLYPQGLWD